MRGAVRARRGALPDGMKAETDWTCASMIALKRDQTRTCSKREKRRGRGARGRGQGGGDEGGEGAGLHSRKEVGEQRHRPRRHRVPLRRVDVDEEEAADGVPRGDEVLLEVLLPDHAPPVRRAGGRGAGVALHRKEDGLAEDVVEGVRVAEEAGEEGVLRRGDLAEGRGEEGGEEDARPAGRRRGGGGAAAGRAHVEQQRARGPEDGLVVEGLALLLRGGEDEGGLSGRVEDGAPLAQLEGA